MRTLKSRLLIHVLALCLAVAPSFGWASHDYQMSEPSGEQVLADAVIVRPVGLVATVIGAFVFVISLPFTIPSGSVGTAAKTLVGAPANFTFVRPIGEFDQCPRGGYDC
jgi:hypothetical protein